MIFAYFPVCPRCSGKWQEYVYSNFCECDACDIQYYRDANDSMMSYRNFLEKGDRLDYYFGSNGCVYHVPFGVAEAKITRLPMLPMNMTPEKLKLYILFS